MMRFVKRVGEEEKRSEQGPKPWNTAMCIMCIILSSQQGRKKPITNRPKALPRRNILSRMRRMDSLVVDPFLGSGAFAIPAIKLDRYFLGIDIDKEPLENALNNTKRESIISDLRLRNTPGLNNLGQIQQQ